jgi:hypothetical protein
MNIHIYIGYRRAWLCDGIYRYIRRHASARVQRQQTERERKIDRDGMPMQGRRGSASLSLYLKICRRGGPIHIYIYRSISISISISMYIYIYTCIYIHAHIYMHTNTNTHTNTDTRHASARVRRRRTSRSPLRALLCSWSALGLREKKKCECLEA